VCEWHEGMRVVMCYAPFVPYALADGLTAILPDMDFSRPGAAHPRRVVQALADHGASCAFASPIIWRHLSRYCERRGIVLPALQRAVTAGAPVPARLHRRLGPILGPGGRLYTPYGATEAMPLSTTNTEELAGTWDRSRSGEGTCVGRPFSGIDLWIIRVTDDPIPRWSDELPVRPGDVGEIVVGGAVVSPAYPLRPDDTTQAKIRRDGRLLHRMGDLGRVDAQGRLWFCGRKADRIQTRHGMLPAQAIENIFNEHPMVFRTAVVGVGAPGAAIPVALVEMEEKAAFSSDVVTELRSLAEGTRFAGTVQRFYSHPAFPVDARHNSKIRRDELARWATRVLGREGTV
ncbi:MAG TPA: AMP-binding protein, partial [bacterium]|nr:AMP-binding protein [bacterium]